MRTALRFLTVLAVAFGVSMATTLSAPLAHADSYKIAYFGDIKIAGKEIGQGQFASEVTGHGTRVDEAGGDFGSIGTICQWVILIALIDSEGNEYSELGDGEPSDCSFVGIKQYNLDGMQMDDGSRIEVRLYSYDELVAKTVHDIEDYSSPWPW